MLVLILCGLFFQIHDSPGQTQPGSSQKGQNDGITPDTEPADEALVEKSENPIADLISVPIQSNFQFNSGISHATVEVFKLQPVIPFHLNADWNLITRTIIPITNQPSEKPGSESVLGLGDINPQFYFSPATTGAITWGIGPTLTLPTGTDETLTNGKWSAGPCGGLVISQDHFVIGLLVNNQWSYAGWGKKPYNQLSLQPSISYALFDGWYLTYSPTMTANWQAGSSNRWTVPVGGGFGKLIKIDDQSVKLSVQAFDNVVHPAGSSDWSFRFQMQFLFPN
ncbi:MAG: hypothetical protein LV480_14985 [Methylacidiphilales bacterium]|nr:hypothetical protein [Candidatus Methylacidiphilales bacterium]